MLSEPCLICIPVVHGHLHAGVPCCYHALHADLQCNVPAGPLGSELPELELAAGAAAEQTTDGAGRAFLGDVGFAENSGRVGAPVDENVPPGALALELCAEAAGLAGSGCAAHTPDEYYDYDLSVVRAGA